MTDILPKSLVKAIGEFEKLPGIGPKTAARLAYHLLRAPENVAIDLSSSVSKLKKDIGYCRICYNLSDSELCSICSDETRNRGVICVVEDSLDKLAIEKSNSYSGLYHVLGGVISPVNGIGPDEIRIDELIKRIHDDLHIVEVILATNPNLEGEATSMFISQKIHNTRKDIAVSGLGRGLPMGSDLEYADSITLRRSMEGRSKF